MRLNEPETSRGHRAHRPAASFTTALGPEGSPGPRTTLPRGRIGTILNRDPIRREEKRSTLPQRPGVYDRGSHFGRVIPDGEWVDLDVFLRGCYALVRYLDRRLREQIYIFFLPEVTVAGSPPGLLAVSGADAGSVEPISFSFPQPPSRRAYARYARVAVTVFICLLVGMW